MSDKRPQITGYKRSRWLDKSDNSTLYGVKAKVTGQGWCGVSEGGKPVLFHTRREADDYIGKMKSERDASGYKIITEAQRKAIASAAVSS